MEGRYMCLDIPETDFMVQVKLADEGVILDIFRNIKDGEVEFVHGTYKFYHEFGVEVSFEGNLDETLENIHDLGMAGNYEGAFEIFERWFHHRIGAG